jgi:hypothetical protein
MSAAQVAVPMKTISRSVPSPLFNASSTIRSVRA